MTMNRGCDMVNKGASPKETVVSTMTALHTDV